MTTAMTSAMTKKDSVREFVYHEAALIDARRFAEWYDLFADDAIYWMPLKRNQQEAELHSALFYEDKLLLKVRIERLQHPRAFSQSTPSYCQHILQRPSVKLVGDRYVTRTPFIYVEAKGDEQFVLAGEAHHELAQLGESLTIHRKRIELLNRDSALPSIQLFP